MIRVLGTVFAALLGLAFGSFLNVCLSRWPEGESIVHPRSHCRACARTLAWWENIPLLSWIALRGRCRACGTWIGWRYPLVEAAVGTLWAIETWRFLLWFLDPSLPTVVIQYHLFTGICLMTLIWILIALAVLDAEHFWLPDWLTWPAIAFGLIWQIGSTAIAFDANQSAAVPIQLPFTHFSSSTALLGYETFLAPLAAAFLILLIRWIYWLIRRREGLGLGDAKLMALLAAWLGFSGALLAFGIGVVVGALLAVMILLVPRHPLQKERWGALKMPLGTFLCIGGIVSALWEQPIIAAYLRWVGF